VINTRNWRNCMIRKCTDEDISDEELEKVINPFYDNYNEYIITYVCLK